MKEEVWKPVPGHNGILASSWGRIKSDPYEQRMPKGGTQTRQIRPTFGYISKADRAGNYFRMRVKIRGKTYKVHILVCSAFQGKRKKKSCVCLHEDDNGLNNREENLRWGTQYENLEAPRFRALMRERAQAKERAINGRFEKAA